MKDSAKNIIISCGSQSWGGLEMIALDTAMLLSKSNIVIIVCYKNSKLESEGKLNNIKVEPVFEKDSRLSRSIQKMKKILKSYDVNIVHSHLSHDLWTLVPALRLTKSKAKLFLTKHMGSGVSKKDILHKYLYNRVTGIFAVSNYIKTSVIETCPIVPEKIHLLPDGIITDKFRKELFNRTTIRKEFGIPEEKIVIGMAGRITPGKGHEQFLEAAKIIKNKGFENVFFLIVGGASYGENSYENEIKQLSLNLGLKNNILFTGFRNDIPEMLAAIDILAFPSHLESFGITLLEAMAMELPVAASNNAGITDIVINEETGLLIPPKNSEKLANALVRLIEEPELRTSFGAAGKKRVNENFDLKIIVDKLQKSYYS